MVFYSFFTQVNCLYLIHSIARFAKERYVTIVNLVPLSCFVDVNLEKSVLMLIYANMRDVRHVILEQTMKKYFNREASIPMTIGWLIKELVAKQNDALVFLKELNFIQVNVKILTFP